MQLLFKVEIFHHWWIYFVINGDLSGELCFQTVAELINKCFYGDCVVNNVDVYLYRQDK